MEDRENGAEVLCNLDNNALVRRVCAGEVVNG